MRCLPSPLLSAPFYALLNVLYTTISVLVLYVLAFVLYCLVGVCDPFTAGFSEVIDPIRSDPNRSEPNGSDDCCVCAYCASLISLSPRAPLMSMCVCVLLSCAVYRPAARLAGAAPANAALAHAGQRHRTRQLVRHAHRRASQPSRAVAQRRAARRASLSQVLLSAPLRSSLRSVPLPSLSLDFTLLLSTDHIS